MKFKLKTLPAKFYLMMFLSIIMGSYLLLNTDLYLDAQEIRTKTQNETLKQADKEFDQALAYVTQKAKNELKNLAEWDEVHQQLTNPSYYFYWHDERLQESAYWKKDYDAVEIYGVNKQLLMHKKTGSDNRLPDKLPENFFQFYNFKGHLDVMFFQKVTAKDSDHIIGYIGLSIDLLPLLRSSYHFTFLNTDSLKPVNVDNNFTFDISKAKKHITFQPIKNPVNEFLWQLIQNFLVNIIIFSLFILALFALYYQYSTLSPLSKLTIFLSKLKQRPTDIIPPPKSHFFVKEFEELKHSLADYNVNLVKAQTELESERQLAFDQSRIDALSNIANRRAFDDHLNQLLLNYHKSPRNVCFVLFDCDYFKAINDTYGHEVGDSVIQISSKLFNDSLPQDVPIYRIGGDEFACLIENKNLKQCEEIISTCYRAIKNYDFQHIGIKEKIAYSVGISFIDDQNAHDLAFMHKQADIALYTAKESIHHKIQIYQSNEHAKGSTLASAKNITAIIKSLQTGVGIEMHYQPVFGQSEAVCYFESLIRIKHKETLIYPNEIFEVVKHRHLEVELDKQVLFSLQTALKDKKLPLGSGVSINLSAETLIQEDLSILLAPFIPLLANYKIVIEIIEDTLISNLTLANEKLQLLRKEGFKISLDDFGSGYSSIRYLAHMPVDIVKFDLSLTHALLLDKKTARIVQTTAEMIRNAGYQLVLEGIETQAHLEAAKAAGATHYQGYLLGKPAPLTDA